MRGRITTPVSFNGLAQTYYELPCKIWYLQKVQPRREAVLLHDVENFAQLLAIMQHYTTEYGV